MALYEDSWALCLVATCDVFFCLSDSIGLCWLRNIKGGIERRTWLSFLAFCVLSACGWFGFIVAILKGFLEDPCPHLFGNGRLESFGTFALAVKKRTHLVIDVVGRTLCGTHFCGRLRLLSSFMQVRHPKCSLSGLSSPVVSRIEGKTNENLRPDNRLNVALPIIPSSRLLRPPLHVPRTKLKRLL